jgi:dynein heavy chain
LNKCFEGIQKVEFADDGTIRGMYSAMGEYVKFLNIINPYEEKNPSQVRNVETWLTEVENEMRACLRDDVKRSAAAYT